MPHLLMWFCDRTKVGEGNLPLLQGEDLNYYQTLKNGCAKLSRTSTPLYLCYMGRMLSEEQKKSMELLSDEEENLFVIDYDEIEKHIPPNDLMKNTTELLGRFVTAYQNNLQKNKEMELAFDGRPVELSSIISNPSVMQDVILRYYYEIKKHIPSDDLKKDITELLEKFVTFCQKTLQKGKMVERKFDERPVDLSNPTVTSAMQDVIFDYWDEIKKYPPPVKDAEEAVSIFLKAYKNYKEIKGASYGTIGGIVDLSRIMLLVNPSVIKDLLLQKFSQNKEKIQLLQNASEGLLYRDFDRPIKSGIMPNIQNNDLGIITESNLMVAINEILNCKDKWGNNDIKLSPPSDEFLLKALEAYKDLKSTSAIIPLWEEIYFKDL